MLTFRLADALPLSMLPKLAEVESRPGYRRVRLEGLLDAGFGACFLAQPEIATIVQDALLHFDGERYRLLAWVIMPNHVHVVLETTLGWPLSTVLWSWKSFTANEANKLLRRTGAFWQADYFDRVIRDERHLQAAIEYVENNPVQAGLVATAGDWRFGSASVAGPTPGTGRRPALPEGRP